MSNNYYDILGIDQTADAKAIRRAYLTLSLQYHPDKNLDDIEVAKSKFIEIGQAHDTLIDPSKRAIYDQELQTNNTYSNTKYTNGNVNDGDQSYHTYRDQFDSHVAGMSESDLASIVGKISAVAGMVGGVVGSVMMKNNASAAGTNTSGVARGMIGKAGTLVGSVVGSDMASSGVRTLHRRALERVAYKKECQRALDRGEPAPVPPESAGDTDWKVIFQQVKEGVGGNHSSSGGTSTGNTQQEPGQGQGQQQGTNSKLGNLWNKAAPAVKAAMAAHAAHAASSNGGQNAGNSNGGQNTGNSNGGQNNGNNQGSSAGGIADLWNQAAPFLKKAQEHLGACGETNNNGRTKKQ